MNYLIVASLFLVTSLLLPGTGDAFNIDTRAREIVTNPDAAKKGRAALYSPGMLRYHLPTATTGVAKMLPRTGGGSSSISRKTARSSNKTNSAFFGNDIKFQSNGQLITATAVGAGKVFSCPKNSTNCDNISPTTNLTNGQPINALNLAVDQSTGKITACLPLMTKECKGHVYSMGFCFKADNASEPWKKGKDKGG